MKKNTSFRFTTKEGLVMLFLIIVFITLGRWAYLFLPPDLASKAQVLSIEGIFAVILAFLCVFIWKIAKKIERIEKHLEKNLTNKL